MVRGAVVVRTRRRSLQLGGHRPVLYHFQSRMATAAGAAGYADSGGLGGPSDQRSSGPLDHPAA